MNSKKNTFKYRRSKKMGRKHEIWTRGNCDPKS